MYFTTYGILNSDCMCSGKSIIRFQTSRIPKFWSVRVRGRGVRNQRNRVRLVDRQSGCEAYLYSSFKIPQKKNTNRLLVNLDAAK